MDQDQEKEFKDKLNKLKPKKKKLAVPAEFLQEAKSYEDKLILVKHLTEREKDRVLLIIKSMLSDDSNSRDKK
jgi:hypothetical protein